MYDLLGERQPPPSITLSAVATDCSADKVVKRGEIPEWTKGTDCKSVAERFRGSNPLLPTIPELHALQTQRRLRRAVYPAHIAQRQSTSLVKKRSWVRFPVWAGPIPSACPGAHRFSTRIGRRIRQRICRAHRVRRAAPVVSEGVLYYGKAAF